MLEPEKSWEFATRAIHAGQPPDPATGSVVVPIYQTSTFVQEDIGVNKGYEYSRIGNPTRTALEKCLASLEEGRFGLAFASGLAAATAVVGLLRPGDHVITTNDVYGGTYRLFQSVAAEWGLKFSFVDARDVGNIESAMRPETRMVWLESPTNPMLRLVDIAAVSEIAQPRQVLVVVDNTFMTPYFQRPLSLGADVIVHSATKYLSGHSDVVAGAVVTASDTLYQRLHFLQSTVGAILGPTDAWLVLRGLKTLSVRMREHEKNAIDVATFLHGHPLVEQVNYPGLPCYPQHELALRQMSGFGGTLSFEVKGGFAAARKVLRRTKLFALAVSLGGVESLISHPATMTHASIPPEQRKQIGITEGLIRISVGLEDVADLLQDLEDALEID